MVRSAQTRCRELTVVLPDQAKSAATLLALGAHCILMGPFGDLGPVDPQIPLTGAGWVSAKDIIASVEDASARIEAAPASYPFWSSLFSNLTGIMVQQARTAIARSTDQLREALAANPDRTPEAVEELATNLQEKLIDAPRSHAAVFGAADASAAGLPITELDATGDHWHEIWRLWSRYAVLGPDLAIYEGERASQLVDLTV
jgi:membrane-bound ClpP family serine protease